MRALQIFFITILLSLACKTITETNSEILEINKKSEKVEIDELAVVVEFFGRFGNKVEPANTELFKLPTSGSVPQGKEPYSGYWYPESNGGTAIYWDDHVPSALKKYDAVFNEGQEKATLWELTYHGASPVSWLGHGRGWAAAALRHEEPRYAVQRGSVSFGIRDIKALLAEIYMSSKMVFVGGEDCEKTFNLTVARQTSQLNSCPAISPVIFHLTLANWIGIGKRPILADIVLGEVISPVPVYAYNAKLRYISRAEAIQKLNLGNDTPYPFSPDSSVVEVKTEITYSQPLSTEPAGNGFATILPGKRVYAYLLELRNNADGEKTDKDGSKQIVQGRWIGETVSNRPEYLWYVLGPTESNGTKNAANHFVNPAHVINMWAESIKADPENLPLDLVKADLDD